MLINAFHDELRTLNKAREWPQNMIHAQALHFLQIIRASGGVWRGDMYAMASCEGIGAWKLLAVIEVLQSEYGVSHRVTRYSQETYWDDVREFRYPS